MPGGSGVKVLALTKYGSRAASTRQRFLQYRPALKTAGIEFHHSTFFENDHLQRLTAGRKASPQAVVHGYVRRLRMLAATTHYHALWVQYELFPYWPGFAERLGAWTGKPIIVDYDDAIFHTYDASSNRLVRSLLGNKLAPLLRSASAVCCGNSYLQDYVSRYCERTMILPTVVDTDSYVPSVKRREGPVVIGWIGSPSTWAFVRPMLPVLRSLAEEFGVIIRAIGAGNAAAHEHFPGLQLVEWSEAGEISAVQEVDIGIMPVGSGAFERGKCGYKLIQYMACGLPVVASPVGVNGQIVHPGGNGYLAQSPEDWRQALVRLIEDPELRATLGRAGRARIVADYSLSRHAPRLIELFQSMPIGQTA